MMGNDRLIRRVAAAVGGIALVAIGAGMVNAQDGGRTVWTGIFTADQAARGKAAYGQQCAACHGATLAGGDSAPPISGATFLNNWNNTSAGDLFERIHSTMPLNDPGSLGGKTVSDIEAYIFQANGFPAGAVELPPSQPMMANVRILATKPGG